MRCIIAGGRDITNFRYVCEAVLASGWWDEITEVVSGKCRGADYLGELWADAAGKLIKLFPVPHEAWEILGKAAGPIRNRKMAEYADALILVWDGQSSGSKSMLEIAEEHKLRIFPYLVLEEVHSNGE